MACTPLGTTTPTIGLCKPGDLEEVDWAPALNSNFDLIDAAFAGITARTLAVSTSNTPAQNRAAIQDAHDSLPAAGGILWLTQYGIHINAAINITKPVLFLGPGLTEISTPGVFGLYQDTAATTLFNVTAKGPFILRDLSMSLAATAIGIVVDGPTGALKGTEMVLVDNCQFNGGATCVDIRNGIFYAVRRSQLWNYTAFGVKVNNTLDVDQGDGQVEGCTFSGTATGNGFYWQRGGGVRLLNNKFLGNDYAIQVDVLANPSTSDIIIMGGSIENFQTGGILITRSAGAQSIAHVQIGGGLQIAQYVNPGSGIIINPIGAGLLVQALTIIGVTISDVTGDAIVLREVNGGTILGNHLDAGSAAFNLDATVLNVLVGENNYYASPAIITGAPGVGTCMHGGTIGGSAGIPVADLPAFGNGSQAFASDGKNPGDAGYAFGAVAGGGTGTPTYRVGGAWKA